MADIKQQKVKSITGWDKLGVFVSSLCIVHCLLLPVLIVAFPTLASFLNLDEEKTHLLLMAFLVPAALFAVYSGYRMHGEYSPMKWLVLGLLFVIFGTFFAHALFGHDWEPLFVILGSIFLVRGHILNSHHCKKCEEDHHCIWEHDHQD